MNSVSAAVMGVARKLDPDEKLLVFKRAKVATAPAMATVARICFI